jgi:FtsH-binding integral membrane protein
MYPSAAKRNSAINEAFGAATVVAVLSLIFCLMPTSSESNSSDRLVILIACVVFGLLCIGMFLRSRIAAGSALVLFSVTTAFAMLTQGPRFLIVRTVILFAFLNGVRDTFAYHELSPKPVGLPSIQQSFQAVRAVPPSGDEPSHHS